MAKRKHGPSTHERRPGSPTDRHWRRNLIALIMLGVAILFVLMLILRRAV